jgi:hypothetical protein
MAMIIRDRRDRNMSALFEVYTSPTWTDAARHVHHPILCERSVEETVRLFDV